MDRQALIDKLLDTSEQHGYSTSEIRSMTDNQLRFVYAEMTGGDPLDFSDYPEQFFGETA